MQSPEAIRRAPAALACCAEPCGADLVMLTESALFRLALRGMQDAGWPAPGPRPMPQECAVEIQAPIQGLMVLRCDEALTRYLCPGLRPGRGANLARLLLRKIAETCVASAQRPWRYRLRPSRPERWPQREPDQARAVMLGADAVEIRFWSVQWKAPAKAEA